jgi:hypothetical protein
MGRIFIASGYPLAQAESAEISALPSSIADVQSMIQLRELTLSELRSRGFEAIAVPADLSLQQAVDWINVHHQPGDVALEIRANGAMSDRVRGTSVWHIAGNDQRRGHAELLLFALLRRVPQMTSRGAKADSFTPLGYLQFCRSVAIPALVMQVGVFSHPQDREVLQGQQRELALGLADGLASWSRAIAALMEMPPDEQYPSISILLNGGVYGDRGLLIHGNAYVPIDLADQLGIDLAQAPWVHRISHHRVVYLKAIDLRNANIAVRWESDQQAISLRSALPICGDRLDQIMGHGSTSDIQLMMFLKSNNEETLTHFADVPKLYREEANIEGVNYDLAFAQMCLETDFLSFSLMPRPKPFNFGGLRTAVSPQEEQGFSSARLGIRAHIQHLKAYASQEPLVQEQVDPRFCWVKRGVAPSVYDLSGRWSTDPYYGEKIVSIVRRLYESAGLL